MQMTYEEFLLLPENHNHEIYEWINGQVVKMARPIIQHQRICDNLITIFKNYLYGKNCQIFSSIDVQLVDNDSPSHVSPDLCVICGVNDPTLKRYVGSPELCIEVLSSNKDHDLVTKKRLYLENSIKEYWIVNPFDESILINILVRKDEEYYYEESLYKLKETKTLCPSIFPRLFVNLSIVFNTNSLSREEFLEYNIKDIFKLTKKELLKLLEKYNNEEECNSNDV